MHIRTLTRLALAAAIVASAAAFAADTVAPATLALSNIRGEPALTVSAGAVYRGTTLALTNCICYSDTAGVVTQGLSNVAVTVAIGTLTSCTTNTATVTGSASNKWACTFTVPSVANFTIEVKLTDQSGNSFIYPAKNVNTSVSLQ